MDCQNRIKAGTTINKIIEMTGLTEKRFWNEKNLKTLRIHSIYDRSTLSSNYFRE